MGQIFKIFAAGIIKGGIFIKKISKIFEAILQALIYFVIVIFIVSFFYLIVKCIAFFVGKLIANIIISILAFVFVVWCIYQNNK